MYRFGDMPEVMKDIYHNNIRHMPFIAQMALATIAAFGMPILLPVLIFFACFALPLRIFNKLLSGSYKGTQRLDGKTVLITGPESGIGFEVAVNLARRGARLILACYKASDARATEAKIRELSGNDKIVSKNFDQSDMRSVRQLADELNREEEKIDILINNAGIQAWEQVVSTTDDGLEYQMAVNYFGAFLLTNLIIDLLKRAAPSRIINYGSVVHWRARELDIDNLNFQKGGAGYFKIYGTSKLCVMLFTRELARRLQGTGVVANVLHPGLTDTPTYDRPQPFWFRVVNWLPRKLLFKTPEEGAQTTIYLAVAPEAEHMSGQYFTDCSPASSSKLSQDPAMAKRLWDKSAELVGLRDNERKI
ncbi:retinol dehydrogenase 13-like [Artemia franciscana]|uniref:retinol dehydrogenase 13-like n=1 Tax=Artemia franciscana TaxID=6661 RepID=UPI0032DB3FCD